MGRRWSCRDIEFLIANFPFMSDHDLSIVLSRTKGVIENCQFIPDASIRGFLDSSLCHNLKTLKEQTISNNFLDLPKLQEQYSFIARNLV